MSDALIRALRSIQDRKRTFWESQFSGLDPDDEDVQRKAEDIARQVLAGTEDDPEEFLNNLRYLAVGTDLEADELIAVSNVASSSYVDMVEGTGTWQTSRGPVIPVALVRIMLGSVFVEGALAAALAREIVERES